MITLSLISICVVFASAPREAPKAIINTQEKMKTRDAYLSNYVCYGRNKIRPNKQMERLVFPPSSSQRKT